MATKMHQRLRAKYLNFLKKMNNFEKRNPKGNRQKGAEALKLKMIIKER